MLKKLLIIALAMGMVGTGFVPAPITPALNTVEAAQLDCKVNYNVLKGGVRLGTNPQVVAAMFKVAGVWPCLPYEVRLNVKNWKWARPDHSIRMMPGPGLEELIRTERGRTIKAWEQAIFMGRDRFGREWWVRSDCTNAGYEPVIRKAQKPVVKPTPAPRQQVVVQQQVTVIGDCNNVSVNGQNVTQTTNCPQPAPTPEATPAPQPTLPPPSPPTPSGYPFRLDILAKDQSYKVRQVSTQANVNGQIVDVAADRISPVRTGQSPVLYSGKVKIGVNYRDARLDGRFPISIFGPSPVIGAAIYHEGSPSATCPAGTWRVSRQDLQPVSWDGTWVWYEVEVTTDTRFRVELRSVPGIRSATFSDICQRPLGR